MRIAAEGLHKHALQVEDDVGDIFRAALDRRKLVTHPFNLDGRDRRPLDRAQENTTEGVANRPRIADFERFRDETGVSRGLALVQHLDVMRHLETAQTDSHVLPPLKVNGENDFLARVKLDDGLLVNDRRDLLAGRDGENLSLEVGLVEVHPNRQLRARGGLNRTVRGVL